MAAAPVTVKREGEAIAKPAGAAYLQRNGRSLKEKTMAMNDRGPNRVLDEFARIVTDTAGAAQGVRREVETAVRSQLERFVNQLDLVKREEFEVVREMAIRARAENEELKRRLSILEGRSSSGPAADEPTTPSPAPPSL